MSTKEQGRIIRKFSQYEIYEKNREYKVIEFPFIEHMWAFHTWPAEDEAAIDGGVEVFRYMEYAMTILADHPDRLIYFPCKQQGIGRFYPDCYNLVLCRAELQFRRSQWARIRGRLDKKHEIEKFRLQYNRARMDQYYESGLGGRYRMIPDHPERMSFEPYVNRMIYDRHIERIVGDTIFIVFPKEECHIWRYHLAKDLDAYRPEEGKTYWSICGWILSEKQIQEMKETQLSDEYWEQISQ